jgi:hypothetical protein
MRKFLQKLGDFLFCTVGAFLLTVYFWVAGLFGECEEMRLLEESLEDD